MRKNFWYGVVLILLADVAWSTAGLFPRLLSTDMPTTLFWRSVMGGITVFVFYSVQQWQKLRLHHDRTIRMVQKICRLSAWEWKLSAINAAAMLSFVSAFYFTSVANVTFIYGAFPIITMIFSVVWLQYRLHRFDALCGLGVLLGVGVLVSSQWLHSLPMQGDSFARHMVGIAVALTMTVLFALMTVGIKRYPGAEMAKVTYVGASMAALAVLGFASPLATSGVDLLWLWLFGFLNIALGFGLFLMGAQYVKPVQASLLCLVEVPLAPLWAYLAYGDTVPALTLVGGGLVLLCVIAYLAVQARWAFATPGLESKPVEKNHTI